MNSAPLSNSMRMRRMNFQRNKIRFVTGGTRSAAKPLCETCSRSTVMKGAAESHERVYCHSISGYIDRPIVECNSYHSIADVSLRTMEDVAWILVTKKAGREIGFLKAAQWKKENKFEEVIPD